MGPGKKTDKQPDDNKNRLDKQFKYLRDSEAKLTALFENSPDFIMTVDADGIVTYINRANPGFSKSDFIGKDSLDFIPIDGREKYKKILREAFEKGDGDRFEVSSSKRFYINRIVPLKDENGKVTEVMIISTDITEMKRVEEALRENEYWLKESQRVARVGSYVLDITTGVWTSSDVLDEIFGIDKSYVHDVEGWGGLIHPIHRDSMLRYFQEEVVGARKPFNREYLIVRANDGAPRWVQGFGELFFDAAGNPIKMAGTIQDITDQRKLTEQIQHTQKLESLGVLAGGIAHDFNNLLTAILGNTDLALLDLPPTSGAKSYLEDIVKTSQRAADLCKQMLAYSGKGKFFIESVNMSDVVAEMAHILEISISKKAVLKYNFGQNLPPVMVDVTQLRQIVLNMITNASEAIGDRSGVISVTTGAMECDMGYLRGAFIVDDIPEGIYTHIEVTDTGCGMDEETRSKIFDPFFTTKFTGRGLGLAAVLGIVRGHKGAIKVYSEKGKGTTFKVLLPAAKCEETSSRLAAHESRMGWTGKGTVLLVDDEETIRAVGRKMLEKLGFDVVTAADGRSALEVYSQSMSDIVCIILDLTMPHMDGEEAFRELRRMDANVRVIMSSGYNEQEVTQRFVGKGLAGFIQKPYRVDAFVKELRKVLEG